MTTRAQVVTGIVLVGVGIVIGGLVGALAALAAVLLGAWRGPRAVAAVAFVLLVAAALLTAFEAPATGQARDYLFDFARDRPLAADAGLVAGVFVLAAVVLAAVREREPSSRVHEGGTSG
jgi:MFS family permease